MAIQLAGCVIKDAGGRVLLIHRNTERLVQWELPGGKVEPGEDLEAAAVREIAEEVGVVVKIERHLGIGEFDDNGHTWEYNWFEASIVEGEPVLGEPDRYDGIRYIDIFEINPAELSINVVNLIEAVRSGRVNL